MMRPLVRALALVCGLALASRAGAQLLELVTDDVPQPIYLASSGDDRLFVVSRPGAIYVVEGGSVRQTPFLDISGLVDEDGEGGLLSMAFDPNYATNGRVFVYYIDNSGDSVLARYERLNENQLDPASGHILLTIDQPASRTNHKGGTVAFGPDDLLYLGLGDGGGSNDPDCNGQRTDTLLGKMLRLDVDVTPDVDPWHEPAAGNPFDDPNDAIPDEIWATGLRNPFRFSFDRDTGDLWIGDVGQGTREEIDVEDADDAGGRNYGWKREEGSFCPSFDFASCPVAPPVCGDPAYTRPVFEYDSVSGSHAITGGIVYRGASTPEFAGRYIFGDSSTGDIWALSASAPYTAERLGDGGTPVAFAEDAAGDLYLADLGGRVYRLHLDGSGPASSIAACVNAANARVAKYASAAEKDARNCAALAAKGKLGAQTADQCAIADSKGALAKQQAQLEQVEAKRCEATPAFGFAGSQTAGAAAEAAGRELAQLALGPNLDAALVTKADDKVAAACQQEVLKALGSCQNARRKELLRCKKAGLKDGSIGSAEALAECLDADPAGRVERACAKLATRTLPRKGAAPAVELEAAFPGCAESDVADLADCLDAAGRCAHCRTFSAADGLGVDCDAFDDATGNGSCPE
jgi:glucose/arabinose dehydrogenase